ncbi:helix-turn-helix domain-containing protein [Flexibacterium corallicola]|uniref:helix-turn-helix domain-containing protein n=1 Tax=Flexibacterium corallicola TaxID=3037259 RepID=UPI00286F30D2|nr:helix-turn-helix domain-containing protein [Pseudovibrio sp. M1P-2-3]
MKIENHVDLGSAIRKERKAQHLTLNQLSSVSGVGIRYIRELETGKSSCQIGLAFLVMQALGLSIEVKSRSS